jgi:FkbM family methyltransferase
MRDDTDGRSRGRHWQLHSNRGKWRIHRIWSQLGLIAATRVYIAEHVRRILAPSSTMSYAQSGEDLILATLLDVKSGGLYVDVGCNAPILYSNTYRLHLNGWRGLVVDANSDFAPLYARERPLDTYVTAAISDDVKDVRFEVYEDAALSNLDATRISTLSADRYKVRRVVELRTRRLQQLLDDADFPKRFDLLSIDVENHDLPCLRSIDLTVYRPRVIVIEAHGANLADLGSHPIAQHVAPFGYAIVAYSGNNLFFKSTAPE